MEREDEKKEELMQGCGEADDGDAETDQVNWHLKEDKVTTLAVIQQYPLDMEGDLCAEDAGALKFAQTGHP